MRDKINNRICQGAQSLVNSWLMPIDGDCPIKISDNLAYALFCSNIAELCKKYYNLGKKHRRIKTKHRACKKYQSESEAKNESN